MKTNNNHSTPLLRMLMIGVTTSVVWSFQSIPSQQQGQMKVMNQWSVRSSSSTTTMLSSTSSTSENSGDTPSFEVPKFAGYEYGEMSIVAEEMKKRNSPSTSLQGEDRAVMKMYLERIITFRPSLIALTDIKRVIPDSKWKLVVSTQDSAMKDLPEDASIYLQFKDETRMDYILQFPPKNFGVKRIVAESTYKVEATNFKNNPGLVTYTYQDVKTDIFGLTNLDANPFGVLQGGVNDIESAYMDGHYWIEMGKQVGFDDTGEPYYNVYVRDFEAGSPDEAQQQLFLGDLHQQTRNIGKQMEKYSSNNNDSSSSSSNKSYSSKTVGDQWD